MLVRRNKRGVIRESAAEQAMRDQEVLRANKELAAYFKGRRTEREARAALKIIKAFVRDRERQDAGSRPPLPGADAARTPEKAANRKTARDHGGRYRQKPRKRQEKVSKGVPATIEPQVNPESPSPSESGERTPE